MFDFFSTIEYQYVQLCCGTKFLCVNIAGNRDSDKDFMPLQPESFFFTPDKYRKTLKIYTRCTIANTLLVIGAKLNNREKRWFIENQQFKHTWCWGRISPRDRAKQIRVINASRTKLVIVPEPKRLFMESYPLNRLG